MSNNFDCLHENKACGYCGDGNLFLSTLPISVSRKGEGGLRTKGITKFGSGVKPLISIITVVYNGEKYLEESILSVTNQVYDNIEYIIVDGGSKDGTLDIIHRYEHVIDYWVSEGDRGIYDAMNKAISLASPGAWVLIIGADDRLLDVTCVAFAAAESEGARNLLFDVEREDFRNHSKRKHVCQVPNADKDFLSFPLHHQGFVFKKDEYLSFDTSLGIHADLHFMYTRISRGGIVKVNKVVSSYLTGGASSYIYINNAKSIYKVAKRLEADIYPRIIKRNFAGFVRLFLNAVIRSLIKRLGF
ncbi:glycosyltransferase family 2 protein [Rheinheimera tangshanensis]|uniref:Glycosyltransferase n=1 Tax=Rheinheimera tangshanensis TaxID=400153 RepID=A0A5C8LUV0_9GAMM|nr:glycosyltransferase family 2 protein [Rheinheimera tangshanensis]TXK80497.1 glycosyltransferase [Rheinheimera tangshanensis]GGM60845.1 hypothetical protein GCM10010920_21880 [Rheinheimera tangshanensis]